MIPCDVAIKPCDETYGKCGSSAVTITYLGTGLPLRRISDNAPVYYTPAGPDRLRLECACGYRWEREPLTLNAPSTVNASAIAGAGPGDPLQANVTLGALNKILEERDRVLIERLDTSRRVGS